MSLESFGAYSETSTSREEPARHACHHRHSEKSCQPPPPLLLLLLLLHLQLLLLIVMYELQVNHYYILQLYTAAAAPAAAKAVRFNKTPFGLDVENYDYCHALWRLPAGIYKPPSPPSFCHSPPFWPQNNARRSPSLLRG